MVQTMVGLACVLAIVLAVSLPFLHAWRETVENRETVCAFLRIGDGPWRDRLRIRYGRLGLPFTFGRPKLIRITVPDKAVPWIESMEQAADVGIQMAASLGMSESVAGTRRRAHTWELT